MGPSPGGQPEHAMDKDTKDKAKPKAAGQQDPKRTKAETDKPPTKKRRKVSHGTFSADAQSYLSACLRTELQHLALSLFVPVSCRDNVWWLTYVIWRHFRCRVCSLRLLSAICKSDR